MATAAFHACNHDRGIVENAFGTPNLAVNEAGDHFIEVGIQSD